jgi:type II secretory pathway pseudopilin PulG
MQIGSMHPAVRIPADGQQTGFTYIGILAAITVMLAVLGAAAEIWHISMQRENERELLFIGHQYQRAIRQHYQQSGKRFPESLEIMLGGDGSNTGEKRTLRRIYRDPITGKTEWGLVPGANGGVAGVFSLSELEPIKKSGFIEADADFDKAEKYSDWKFIYNPKNPVRNASGAVTPNPSGVILPAPGTRSQP